MSKIKIFCIAFVVSIVIIIGTLFLPERRGTTVGIFYNRMTETTYYSRDLYGKGYPFVYYTPSGSDYGANFMSEALQVSFLSIFFISWCILLLIKRFLRNQGYK